MLKIVMRIFFRAGMSAGIVLLAGLLVALWASGVLAAPYAEMIMDARSGKVLRSRNADTQLHPASLTKMMTLYVAIEAVENGEIGLDTKVKISSFAASEPPSKLYMKAGSESSTQISHARSCGSLGQRRGDSHSRGDLGQRGEVR